MYFKGALIFFLVPLLNLIPFIGPFIALGLYIWLGIKGNRIAWQQRRWNSVEHFHKVQKIWGIVGGFFFFITLSLAIFAMLLPILTMSKELESSSYSTNAKKSKMNLEQAMQIQCIEQGVPSNFANGLEFANWLAPAFKLNNEVVDIDGMGALKLQNSAAIYVFKNGGDCVEIPCIVAVDINSMEEPNQMGQDRIEFKIKRNSIDSCPTID